MELETWIATQGGKTFMEKLLREVPKKLRQSESQAEALRKILATKKRGDWATLIWAFMNSSE